MSSCIKLKKSNCKNCYKCIRNCPVKSIKFKDDQADIVQSECIMCGMCFVACPQNAKEIRNDVGRAKTLIASGSRVYVSLAPSFKAFFAGSSFFDVQKALLKLGFYAVEETAHGAQAVAARYDEILNRHEQDIVISSCCPTVNLLIEKYYPSALPYLAKVSSPMLAHCSMIKKRDKAAKTVFIGPCISKKDEGEGSGGSTDCVLTFEEAANWLCDEGIAVEESAESGLQNYRSRLFPTAGGILKTMNCSAEDYTYISIDGTENCIKVLDEIAAGAVGKCFIEMSACASSCIGGPAMNHRKSILSNCAKITEFAGNALYASADAPQSLVKEFSFIGTGETMPGAEQISEVLKKMGKTKPQDELNCGSCGYGTCKEKAAAVCLGKADLTMCLPYLKDKAESFSDKIINNTPNAIVVLDEQLNVQQINESARKLLNVRCSDDVIGSPVVRILEPQDYLLALSEGRTVANNRKYLSEYSKYVEETVVFDPDYKIIISIMRDITEQETQREKKEKISRQTIDIADKVVEKQLRVVQEIASLLGETAAETQIALTGLKEIYKQ